VVIANQSLAILSEACLDMEVLAIDGVCRNGILQLKALFIKKLVHCRPICLMEYDRQPECRLGMDYFFFFILSPLPLTDTSENTTTI
jgi:hypothetical protein